MGIWRENQHCISSSIELYSDRFLESSTPRTTIMIKTLGIRSNFLGIEEQYSSFAKSKVVVLPVPYEQTVSYGVGTKLGPGAILKASHQVEFYDEETGREVHKELGIATLPPLAFGKRTGEGALELIHN